MRPPGLLRLKVMTVTVLAVEVAVLGSELTILDLFLTERFTHRTCLPTDRPTKNPLRTQISPGLKGGEIRYIICICVLCTCAIVDDKIAGFISSMIKISL